MKVLWLVNITLPRIAKENNQPVPVVGGWLTGMLDSILVEDDLEIAICFPEAFVEELTYGCIDNLQYYCFPQKDGEIKQYNSELSSTFKKIIKEFKPDIIHIWGTEYPQTYSMMCAGNSNRTIISITGMVSVYAYHYFGNLPEKYIKKRTMMRLLSKLMPRYVNILSMGKEDFEKRGAYEVAAVKKAKHITGRTDWDKACTKQINSDVSYYSCNETLREIFYNANWKIKNCKRHTIFVSQAGYPIKGLHKLLEALPIILKRFPDAHVYVGGTALIKNRGLIKNWAYNLLNPYASYLKQLIKRKKLGNHVTFLGPLDEKSMCEQYLNANLFVLPSYIENSPNSLGEAMLLGVPCIAADVGGVKNMLVDKEEGFIYPFNEYYMLAYYICEVFSSDELAIQFSEKARQHALITHDREFNKNNLISIYENILSS